MGFADTESGRDGYALVVNERVQDVALQAPYGLAENILHEP
jgi:hypothetical protein